MNLNDATLTENHQLVAYGAGLCLLQMQAIGYKFVYAVDDTPGIAGKISGGVPIFPSDRLRELEPQTIVVICASKPRSILAIASRLNSLGMTWGKNYIDCTAFQFPSALSRLERELSIRGSTERFSFVRTLSLYSNVNNLSCATGTWLLTELLEHCGRKSAGAIAECGVYFGGNAFVALMASEVARRNSYYLLDSFEGFQKQAPIDPASSMAHFKDANLQQVRDLFRNFDNIRIRQGFFDQTIPTIRDQVFLGVYVDCDLYEPTKFLCEQLYDRVVNGGFILFHDYWFPEEDPPHAETYKGVNKAVREFLGSRIGELVVFPETTHAVLIKR